MLRVAEHLLGLPHLDDGALAQYHRLVAYVVAEGQVMGNEQDPEALALQVDEQVEDVDARRGIEHAYDLVRDEELDLEQQSASDQQALLLAARELVGELVEDVSRG